MVKVEPKRRPRTPAIAPRRASVDAAPERTPEQARLALHARLDALPVAEVWAFYRAAPSRGLRDYLIEKHLHLVRYHAERLHTRLPAQVEVDDLFSSGLLGLIAAIDDFHPERGVKFETYASLRITGAMIDELRALDWVPRLPRARAAKVERLRARMLAESGRRPTDPEVLERLRAESPDADLTWKDRATPSLRTFANARPRDDEGREAREVDTLRDARQPDPLRGAQAKDLRDSYIKGLSRAERLIVILYYQEEMTMREIGATLSLSESRVSQLHALIMTRLRDMAHRCAGEY